MRSAVLPFLTVFVGGACLPRESLNMAQLAPDPAPPEEHVVATNVPVGSDGSDEGTIERAHPRRPAGAGLSSDPVFFHLGAGYGALGRIDLDSCRDQGLVPGFLHL